MKPKFGVLSLIAFAVSACTPAPPAIYQPYDHPADPHAPTGEPIQLSGTLRPELKTVAPDLGAAGQSDAVPQQPQDTQGPGDDHRHHR